MNRTRWMVSLLLLCLLAVAPAALADQAAPALWQGPSYNPAPLMSAAAQRCTDDRYTFAVFGDSYGDRPLVDLLKMVDARSPHFVVELGDMVSRGAGPKAPEEWKQLSDNAGWFMRKYATWPVIGNHEVDEDYDEGLANFLRFYGVSDQNYAFTFRNSKFIVLGMDREWRQVPPDQLAFLRRELADRDKYDHVFVFRHVPFYTIGNKDKDEVPNAETELVKAMEQGRVTAVFSGHDHYYYHTKRHGIHFFISGVAGGGVYPLRRLAEQAPGDSYMGVSPDEQQIMLHVPGRVDRFLPYRGGESENKMLFSLFIHVDGERVTADVVCKSGEVWDSFVITGEPFELEAMRED